MKLLMLSLLLLATSCSAQLLFLQPSLSQPERVPELGLTPRYHSLVFDYIQQMAGNHPPAQVKYAYPARIEDFGVRDEPALPDVGSREPVTEGPVGTNLRPHHLLPSDFVLLTRSPQSQFFGNFDVIKNKKMKLASNENALPPLGGVISNYILQRDFTTDKVKRQAYTYSREADDQEGVVIQSATEHRAGEENDTSNSSTGESKEETQPSVAQSKPQAIALAGIGGVAQAAPVATAIVGKDGLAISAPSATAVAGQGTQGAIQIAGDEKMKRISASKSTEEKKE